MQTSHEPAPQSERLLVFLLAAVQFINVLEFMIILPLGPDFAKPLNISPSSLGIIGGSYTAAASISGLLASLIIERFDRRIALGFCMIGLVVATFLCGLVVDLPTLVAARVLAGCFGGPASSLSLAIVADAIPFQRRGKAMGTVLASFSVASVLGIPAGLELARYGGWRAPFFAIAALGIVVAGLAIAKLPPLRAHLDIASRSGGVQQSGLKAIISMIQRPVVALSLLMMAFVMMGVFFVIPNISAYIQGNLHFPRSQMSLLYLVGGVFSFITMRWVGKLVDRHGSLKIAIFGTVFISAVLVVGFAYEPPTSWVMPIFVLFMASSSFRSVPMQTLSSRVPEAHERARYMSLQSAVQHVAIALGAFISSAILTEGEGGRLQGVATLSWLAIALGLTLPFMMLAIQRRLNLPKVPEATDQF